MTKSNVAKVETMMADFLQYRYKLYCLMGRKESDWEFYLGACGMVESCGGCWERHYTGDDTEEQKNDYRNYKHYVTLPSDERFKRINADYLKGLID